jgi:ubiquinone/menaquinone biosynthesis C-methylase UbiE
VTAETGGYVLGHAEEELTRLDRQAQTLATGTRALLREVALPVGGTVLDLGTGTGGVAVLLAELVGPTGRVVGLDRSGAAVDHARRQAALAGLAGVEFVTADVAGPLPVTGADAVVCRLVLAYQADPVAVLRRWAAALHPGGQVVVLEFDFSGGRAIPSFPLVERVRAWIAAGFEAARQPQTLGPQLPRLFAEAGLDDVRVLGAQSYVGPHEAAATLAGVLRSLTPAIEGAGVATREELDLDRIEQRLVDEFTAYGAVFCPPTLVGCWGRMPRVS